MAWCRQMAARKYDSSKAKNRTKGRPRETRNAHDLVVRLAQEAGLDPAPERLKNRTWKQFLKIHFETLYACDFFSVEVLGVLGTVNCTPMPSSGF